jgi:cell division protein FtsB
MTEPFSSPAESPARRPWLPLGVVAVVLVFALFGDRGFLYLFKLKRQQADLQGQLAQVEAVNDGLRREIASLSSDRQHLERLARSQLGMVREDEIVYQFSSKKN